MNDLKKIIFEDILKFYEIKNLKASLNHSNAQYYINGRFYLDEITDKWVENGYNQFEIIEILFKFIQETEDDDFIGFLGVVLEIVFGYRAPKSPWGTTESEIEEIIKERKKRKNGEDAKKYRG